MSNSSNASAAHSKPNGLGPILCAHLLSKVDGHLLELLASLRPDERFLPTISPQWTVRDVAAHLLDTVFGNSL
jgi:hypothetical protein